jgi:hypothetical protein
MESEKQGLSILNLAILKPKKRKKALSPLAI